MSDYEAVRSKESVTSASRALNALRSWVLGKSRRPEAADLDEVIRALRSGPTEFRESLAPGDDSDLPPSSRVFDALLHALIQEFGENPSVGELTTWGKFLGEIVGSSKDGSKTELSKEEAELVTNVLEAWLNALLQRPPRLRPETQASIES